MPQLPGSVNSSASQPFAAKPSQSPKPGLHVGLEQVPPEHVSVPPAWLQALPHVPQLSASVWRFVQTPPHRSGTD